MRGIKFTPLLHSKKLEGGSKCRPSCFFFTVPVYEWNNICHVYIAPRAWLLPPPACISRCEI